MNLSTVVTCPNCKMRVLPKSYGTCPSCQAVIPQKEKESIPESIEPRKKSAASTPLKQEPSPMTKIKTTTRIANRGNNVSSIVENNEIAKKHFDQSYKHWEKSKYEEALEECDTAIELAPDWSEAHNLRGVILEEMDKPDKAILEYREAVRLDPDNKDAKENLAYADKSKSAAQSGQVWLNRNSKFQGFRIFLFLLIIACILYMIAGSVVNTLFDIDLPYRTDIGIIAGLILFVVLIVRFVIKLFHRYLLIDSTQAGTGGIRRWRRYPFLRVLLVVVVLLIITFPLWNPQKLYIKGLIQDLGNESTRGQAFQVLTQDIGAPAVEPLIDALNDKDPQIRTSAKDALIAIGAPAVKPLVARFMENWNSGVSDVLIPIGAPAVEPLIAALDHAGLNGIEEQLLKSMLNSIGTPAVEPLIAAAREGSPQTRRCAVEILFCVSSMDDECILVREPPTGDTRTRMAELLTALLRDADSLVRLAAVRSLSSLPEMADQRVPLLIAALRDESSLVRSEAAEALGWAHDERAVPPLVAALNDEAPEVRGKAALALARTGVPGINALVAAFEDEELATTAFDYKRIIEAGDEASVPVLIAALFSHGDAGMAADYLNCGNSWLESTAERWAEMYGFQITYFSNGSDSGPTWGGR